MDLNTDDEYDNEPMNIESTWELQVATNISVTKEPRICVICGADAVGINFSVLTCVPCKAFFRRNGLKPLDNVKCRSNGQCKISQRSRRQCTACRIRKCFAMGMVKERIRTEEQNKRHRELIEGNRKTRSEQTKNHAHHESEIIINDCYDSYCLQTDFQMSCADDLHHLFLMTVDQLVPKEFIFDFNSDLTDVLNLYCIPVSCLIAYIKQLPHFQSLPVDDRIILLKNNTKILLPTFACLFNLTFDTPFLVNHSGVLNINDKMAYSCLLFSRLIKNDCELLLLIITLFLFSPCLLTRNSLISAGHIKNESYELMKKASDEYTSMLWDCIMERSSNNKQQAIIKYTKIVTTITRLQNITSDIYDGMEGLVQIDKLHLMLQSVLHLI